MCNGLHSEILGDQTLAVVNPYLSPFAIEFSLIGACVAYAMFQKIGIDVWVCAVSRSTRRVLTMVS